MQISTWNDSTSQRQVKYYWDVSFLLLFLTSFFHEKHNPAFRNLNSYLTQTESVWTAYMSHSFIQGRPK